MNNSINVNPSSKVALEPPSNLKGQQGLEGLGGAMQLLGGKAVLGVERTSNKAVTSSQQPPALEAPTFKPTAEGVHKASEAVFSPHSSGNAYSPLLALIAIFDLLQKFAKESTSLAISNTTTSFQSVLKGVESTKKGAVWEVALGGLGAAVTGVMGVVSVAGAGLSTVYAGRPVEVPEAIPAPKAGAQGAAAADILDDALPSASNSVAQPQANQSVVDPDLELDDALPQPANQSQAQELQQMPEDPVDAAPQTRTVEKRFTWADPAFASRIQQATMLSNGITDAGKALGQVSSTVGQYKQQTFGAESQKQQGISQTLEKEEGQAASSVQSARQTATGVINDLSSIMQASSDEIGSASQITG